MVAGGLLVGVGDGEESGFAVQPAGEGDRARAGPAVDIYHYRFWGQVVRWMAYQRNMAKGETMRLYYVPDQPKMNRTVSLHTNIMDRAGEPLKGGDVSAFFTAPSGKSERVRFTSVGDEWGVFSGRFTPSEPGKHDVTLACKQTGATLETSFFVQGAAARLSIRPWLSWDQESTRKRSARTAASRR